MRAIKFRAWHKLKKHMYDVSGMSYSDSDGELTHVCVSTPVGASTRTLECFPVAEVELLQFTGLYDATGDAIYEGDILHINADRPEDENILSVVTWDESGCWRAVNRVASIPVSPSMLIIGNIYEHPEIIFQ